MNPKHFTGDPAFFSNVNTHCRENHLLPYVVVAGKVVAEHGPKEGTLAMPTFRRVGLTTKTVTRMIRDCLKNKYHLMHDPGIQRIEARSLLKAVLDAREDNSYDRERFYGESQDFLESVRIECQKREAIPYMVICGRGNHQRPEHDLSAAEIELDPALRQ
jgi:hypothetical protein